METAVQHSGTTSLVGDITALRHEITVAVITARRAHVRASGVITKIGASIGRTRIFVCHITRLVATTTRTRGCTLTLDDEIQIADRLSKRLARLNRWCVRAACRAARNSRREIDVAINIALALKHKNARRSELNFGRIAWQRPRTCTCATKLIGSGHAQRKLGFARISHEIAIGVIAIGPNVLRVSPQIVNAIRGSRYDATRTNRPIRATCAAAVARPWTGTEGVGSYDLPQNSSNERPMCDSATTLMKLKY